MALKQFQIRSLFVLSLVAVVSFASGVPALVGPTTIAPLIEEVKDSVVNIAAKHPIDPDVERSFNPFYGQPPRQRERTAIGSGVIIDANNGYIVTNEHVIRGSEDIVVTLDDGRSVNAKVIGDDRASDVAVLQITADNLKALPLSDSDEVRVGDFVVAIGNPYRLQQTVTSGIVSGLGRKGLGIEEVENFIQTDAAINQGNSGGPLITFSGKLIGINTAILGRSGIGFAIPSNMVADVVDELIEFGGITRGFLGIQSDMMESLDLEKYAEMYEIEDVSGAVIGEVIEDTAASRAGLQKYDIITSFNGEKVVNWLELTYQIKLAKVGEEVPIEILRDGEMVKTHVVLQPHRTYRGDRVDIALRGSRVRQINPQDPYFDELAGSGVVVQNIEPDSPAANLDLKVGDVILDVKRPINAETKQKFIEIFREGEVLTITPPP